MIATVFRWPGMQAAVPIPFQKCMRNLEPGFEVDVLASQIYLLSANVSKKHAHVNNGFAFTGLTFLLFMISGLNYLILTPGVL